MVEMALGREKLRRELKVSPQLYNRTYICFIDMKSAFDTLNRDRILVEMLANNLPPECIVALSRIYKCT